MIRAAQLLAVLILGASAFAAPCLAQTDGSYFQDLMKRFVESRIETQPPPNGLSGTQRAVNSPELRRAGEMLTAASNEMSQLVDALKDDIYRAQGVRPLLNLAFNVNADAAVLSRQLSYTNDVDSLRPSLRKLDQDWRSLAYRLNQTQNLSAKTLGHIQRIQQAADQLNAMFQVQTQVDLSSLTQRASQMNQSLRTLLEDIRYEVADRSTADRLFSAGRDTYEQLQRFIKLTRPDPGITVGYDSLKQEYATLFRDWSTYQQQLRETSNRYVQRQVQRINDDMRSMSEALYIQGQQTNRNDLVHATSILRADVDRLLERINLKMLTQLPVAQRYAIEAASDLDQTCNDFAGMLRDEIENIRDVYLYMYDEWQRLALSLQGVSNQEARQAIRDVERSLADLQAMLGVRFELDRNTAIQLASTLNGDARHLQEDVRTTFSRVNNYPRNFQTTCLDGAAQFEAATRRVYNGLSRGEKLQSLAIHMNELATSWNSLSQVLPQFGPGDRSHIAKIEREITPQVIQLQTLLTP